MNGHRTQRLRIAHVTATYPPYRGGTGNVCYNNARELARRGHDVHVFTARQESAARHERLEGVSVHRLNPLAQVGNAPVLPDLFTSLRGFDVLHLHYPFILGAEMVRAASLAYRTPLVVSFHNDLIGNGARAAVFSLYQRVSAHLTVRGAACLCAVSLDHYQSSALCRSLAKHEARTVELPNGVDTTLFRPTTPAESRVFRQKNGVPDHARLILFVAALDRAHHFKGLSILLHALAALPQDTWLLVVGDGELRDDYQREAAQCRSSRSNGVRGLYRSREYRTVFRQRGRDGASLRASRVLRPGTRRVAGLRNPRHRKRYTGRSHGRITWRRRLPVPAGRRTRPDADAGAHTIHTRGWQTRHGSGRPPQRTATLQLARPGRATGAHLQERVSVVIRPIEAVLGHRPGCPAVKSGGAQRASLDSRDNSIASLRFLLAALVVFSHSYDLGGFGPDPLVVFSHGQRSFGSLAVAGFFALSGFLITQSYCRSRSVWRYLWHRILRIFPAFWMCLLVTAFLFAPLVSLLEHGNLAGYLHAGADSPSRYVAANALLDMKQYGIAGLLTRIPYPGAFDGSLWSLHNEFVCYLAIAALGILGIIARHRAILVGLTLCLWTIAFFPTIVPAAPPLALLLLLFGRGPVFDPVLYFFVGSLYFLFRDKIALHWGLFLLASLLILIGWATDWLGHGLEGRSSTIPLGDALRAPMARVPATAHTIRPSWRYLIRSLHLRFPRPATPRHAGAAPPWPAALPVPHLRADDPACRSVMAPGRTTLLAAQSGTTPTLSKR